MSNSFIHTLHAYIIILARYLIIFTAIGFMPVPLFSFLGGDSLTQINHNPLFDYFRSYPLTTDSIIEHVFTNVYLQEDSKGKVEEWEIDNAVMWADAMAYQLAEEGVPVVRHVVQKEKDSDVRSIRSVYEQVGQESSLLPQEIQNILLTLKNKFQLLLPLDPITQDARQWLIFALSSNQKSIKKQLKALVEQYPNDNFLVITKNPVNLSKKTQQLSLPHFDTKYAKKALSEGLRITQKQAEILLVESGKSLWQLNEKKGEGEEITFKSLLGQMYKVLNGLEGREEEVFTEVCKEGKMKVSGKKVDLAQYGVIIKNKYYQWENDNARINYQLQKETLCGNKVWIDVVEEQGENLQLKEEKSDEKKEIILGSEQGQKQKDEGEKDQKGNEEQKAEKKGGSKKNTYKEGKSKDIKQVKKSGKKGGEKKQNQQQTDEKQPKAIQGVSQDQSQTEIPYIIVD